MNKKEIDQLKELAKNSGAKVVEFNEIQARDNDWQSWSDSSTDGPLPGLDGDDDNRNEDHEVIVIDSTD